jgi:hypothetical protein
MQDRTNSLLLTNELSWASFLKATCKLEAAVGKWKELIYLCIKPMVVTKIQTLYMQRSFLWFKAQ